MRSSFLITLMSALALIASAATAMTATQSSHHRPTATVAPNGTSCPSSDAQPGIPADGKTAITPERAHSGALAMPPIVTGTTTCPATGSDAETNIARGNTWAKPEPLNSPSLITPQQ